MIAIQTPRRRRLALFRPAAGALAIMAGLFAASSAQALVVLVTSTKAFVGEPTTNVQDQGLLSASIHSTVNLPGGSSMTGNAVANVFSGHLGASAATTGGGQPFPQAYVFLGLSFSDAEPGDAMLIHMSLHGSFTPIMGSAGTAELSDQNGFFAGTQCSTFNAVNHGTACWTSDSPGDPGHAGNVMDVTIPLYGLDSDFLTFQLKVGVAPGTLTQASFSDFLNSADFSISLPAGTVIQGDPGSQLFGTAPVPEPSALSLLGVGLFCVRVLRGRGANRRD